MPQSSTGGAGIFPRSLDRVEQAVSRKVGARVENWERKARSSLSLEEEEDLDRMREIMVSFETDYELLSWSMAAVFGFPPTTNFQKPYNNLFPDLRLAPSPAAFTDPTSAGPSARLYPDLLLLLFLLLRDTHRSPTSALHVFSVASLTPHSYVVGCTTALYNEVLRTRWMEGDVESVAEGLEEMRSGGVRMDDATKEIVSAIGEAIRIDENRAERRAAQSEELEADAFEQHRFFSGSQLEAWGRMEWIVEEDQADMVRKKEERDEDKRREWESRKDKMDQARREDAERERPNLFSVDERVDNPRGRREVDFPERRTYAAVEREEPQERSRHLRSRNEEQDPYDEDGIDASWGQFPVDRTKSTYRSAPWSEDLPPPRREWSEDRPPPRREPEAGNDDWPPRRPSRTYDYDEGQADEPRGSSLSAGSTRYDASPSRGRMGKDFDWQDGRDANEYAPEETVLPKRPSFANPFKIRRKGLSKEEKARHDTPHPLLFWKPKK